MKQLRKALLWISVCIVIAAGLIVINKRSLPESKALSNSDSKQISRTSTINLGAGGMAKQPALDTPSSRFEPPGDQLKNDYERSEDLYRLAVNAAHSNNPANWTQGFMAVMGCAIVKADIEMVTTMARGASVTSIKGNDRALSSTAAADLLKKCRGFINNDTAANSSLRRTIAERARDGNYYVMGATAGRVSNDHFVKIISSQDLNGFVLSYVDVRDRVLQRHGIASSSNEAAAFDIAYMLAACDAGRDCSERSTTYALICALESKCAGSLERAYAQDVDEKTALLISSYRAKIANALLMKDVSFFGMPR
jgi:hypothetical protein